jgi:hypothetical protein
MKKTIGRILLGLTILASSACTKIDNYGGPNASFEGRIIDATTKENFQTSTGNINIRIEQISWSETPSPQDIPSKMDGTFKDSKLFKGKYRITPMGGPFWPVYEPVELDISSGTKHDFELTPYLVINNLTQEMDGADLKLHFDIDAPIGAGLPTLLDVQPYVNTTKLVGPGASIFEYSDGCKALINKEWLNMGPAEKSITLTVPNILKGRTFYVRVGVRLNDSYKSSNLSKIIEVKIP